jgi:hypothetical protein
VATNASRKARGMRTQKVVAEAFKEAGWPHAETAGAGRPGTDVLGIVGVDVEVKARRGFNVVAAMKQARERSADGTLCVAVIRPDGMGETTISDWPAIVRLADLQQLMKAAGY